MSKPKLLVFASGSSEGGGSGFENLVHASRRDLLDAEIVGVVSNHEAGGVRRRANMLGISFLHFPKPWDAEGYQRLAAQSGAQWFALSGWLKLVAGLDPTTVFNSKTVFNIHPGPLPDFGGPGMYGHHVHEAVIAAYKRGEITHSQVCMHFVTDEYDRGPVFFRSEVEIKSYDTPQSLAAVINKAEHQYQPWYTHLVVNGAITWDGTNSKSLRVDIPLSRPPTRY